MSTFWSPVVHCLTPYPSGEQPKLANLIKLNTNENPYGPSPRVVEDLQRKRQAGKLFLTVAEFNGRAKRLYERLGYHEVGLVPDLFHSGYAEHVMMKRLE